MSWNPELYLRHDDKRTRAAADLLARVPLNAPRRIMDLGCGPGNSTALLAARYPDADVTGLDNAPAMLEKAAALGLNATWVEADAGAYQPTADLDLLYSNATLHWLDDHAALFPRLLSGLSEGGVLAVQMPANFSAPSHRLLHELAHEPPYASWGAGLRPAQPVAPPEAYYDWLIPLSAALDIWTTQYAQIMASHDALFDWMAGTTMTPYTAVLPDPERRAFEATYRDRLSAAYPLRGDGQVLFPFQRLFIIATRNGA